MASAPFSHEVVGGGQWPTVRLAGELDITTIAPMKGALRELRKDSSPVVIDSPTSTSPACEVPERWQPSSQRFAPPATSRS